LHGDFCISEEKCCKGRCGALQCLAAVKKVCIFPVDFEKKKILDPIFHGLLINTQIQ
jgi:hypothetical protein